jgi:hypothetical protein
MRYTLLEGGGDQRDRIGGIAHIATLNQDLWNSCEVEA